ncbi:hypothetical protein LTR08_004175 [Meristemomyces frigidus]|nr:hypothetical protein LTR08_004175 [Meristemomyces frigidus]
MSTLLRPLLWQKARDALRPKDKDVILPSFTSKPEELIIEIERYSSQSKGKSIKLPNGESFFVRDVLERASRWVKKFVEVGDTAVQYDPGHAALPWAAVRLILQVKTLLENLVFDRIAAAFFSSDSKFNNGINKMASWKHSIESCTRQISNQTDHKQYAEVLKVRDQLAELEKSVIRVERAVQSASATLDRNENQCILDWASEIPFQKHFRVVEEKALSGTGKWLSQSTEFSTWHNCSRSQILWLHGSSGSGKSTLISLIIQSLMGAHEQQQAPYPMYFFCSRNTAEPERADPEHILRSLMRQASDLPGGPPLHPRLKERFNQRRIAGDVSAKEATDIIIDTIEDRPLTYIVIDALDECDRQKRDTLVDSLKMILAKSTSLVKIFVTSRDNHQDIAWSMHGYPALCIDASQNQADIDHYVQYSVKNAIERKKLLPTERVNRDLQQRIEESLCNGAAGMFRWVELQIKFLCTLRKRSILLERLDKLPPGLEQIYEDLYEQNMKELGEEQAEVVKRILAWLLVAQRPLHTSEMCELVCAPEEPDMSNETVLDMCFDLVRLDLGQDQFRFSHLSVREFLEKRPSEFAGMSMHSMATCACLSLVTRRDVIEAEDYATTHWPLHAEDATRNGGGPTMEQPLDAFFTTRAGGFLRWNDGVFRTLGNIASWQKSLIQRRLSQALVKDASTIFLTACFGLPIHLRRSVSRPAPLINLELKNSAGEDALYLASQYGHVRNVRILLEKGADVNVQGGLYGNALQAVSGRGHAEVVELPKLISRTPSLP